MDFSSVCRTCLRENNLNKIFADPGDPMCSSNAIYITTGIKIQPEDELPQNICTNCLDFVNESLKFRKCCQEVENKLLNLKKELLNSLEVDKHETNQTNIKLESEIEAKEDYEDVKIEYTDLEVLHDIDDEDDQPLNYFIDEREQISGELILVDEPSTEINNEKVELTKPLYVSKADRSQYKTQRVVCTLCQKELSVRSVDGHMARSHPGADERKKKCELCDNYLTKEKMKRHMKMVHGNEEMLRCGYCKSEFESKEVLVQHVTACTAKNKKRKICQTGRELVTCDICNKAMQKASLKTHKAIKHAGLGPVCEHCGRRFSNKFRLNEHYRAKHGYDKFKCSYCEFLSASITAMRNHERRHRGEKPFECGTCGAKFHATYLLAQHKQSHRTERLIKCDICPASFKANNSLHMHKLSCHSSALYKCFMCPRAYSCRQYAVKHMRTIHRYHGPVPKLLKVDAEVNDQDN